jgi:hypothetical protein
LWIVQALKGPNDEKNNYDPGFVGRNDIPCGKYGCGR